MHKLRDYTVSSVFTTIVLITQSMPQYFFRLTAKMLLTLLAMSFEHVVTFYNIFN